MKRIVAAAASLFNQRGYAGATVADLMAAAGLEKGGIYGHFESKDELALAAFDYALDLSRKRLRSYVSREETHLGRLLAVTKALASTATDPPVPGGCPMLNAAVECDSPSGPVYTALRERTRRGVRSLISYTRKIMEAGIVAGEFVTTIDAEAEARVIVATLEGGMMLSALYQNPAYVDQAVLHVAAHARSFLRQ